MTPMSLFMDRNWTIIIIFFFITEHLNFNECHFPWLLNSGFQPLVMSQYNFKFLPVFFFLTLCQTSENILHNIFIYTTKHCKMKIFSCKYFTCKIFYLCKYFTPKQTKRQRLEFQCIATKYNSTSVPDFRKKKTNLPISSKCSTLQNPKSNKTLFNSNQDNKRQAMPTQALDQLRQFWLKNQQKVSILFISLPQLFLSNHSHL